MCETHGNSSFLWYLDIMKNICYTSNRQLGIGIRKGKLRVTWGRKAVHPPSAERQAAEVLVVSQGKFA